MANPATASPLRALRGFTARVLPDLLGWTMTLLLLGAILTGTTDAPWFPWALGPLAALYLGLVGVPAAAELAAEIRYRRTLLDLDEMSREQYDHTSGVWMIGSPCGYDDWELYAPGQANADHDYPLRDIHPTATMSALDPGPAQELAADPPQSIEQIRGWAVPWVEQVSGGRVVEMLKGWGAPYGPGGIYREVSVYVRVES